MVQVESEVGQKRTNFLIVRSSTFVGEAGMGEDVVGWGGVGVGVAGGGGVGDNGLACNTEQDCFL